MIRAELPYFALLSVVLLSAPFLPSSLLMLLDHVLVRIGAVGLLLYLLSVGPTAGVFGFVAIGVLFLERNRRKIRRAIDNWETLDAMDAYKPVPATVEVASAPQKTVPVAPFQKPDEDETDFLPHYDPSDMMFEPVAPSMNEKAVLASAYPLSHRSSSTTASMESLYEQLGVGHVRGVETMGEAN